MIIDQTRYEAFWRNPEKYRLEYEQNLRPKGRNYDLDRGLAFHEIVDGKRKGKTDEEIGERLNEMKLHPKAVPVAWALWNFYERNQDPEITAIESEIEFVYAIPGSPHSMAGRIDQIIEKRGKLYVGELKTANAKKNFDRVREEWNKKKQADFEIVGARSLGFNVEGLLMRMVVEGTPPKLWPLDVTRTEHSLETTKLHVHQTCETIEMYRAVFGIDKPWPHVNLNWPCSSPGRCEYEGICNQDSCQLTQIDLEGFMEREEHLDVLKRLNEEKELELVEIG